MNRAGAIDIGSNSVKLWVAEKNGTAFPKTIEEQVKVTRLGKDLEKRGIIHRARFQETVEVVREFTEQARSLDVEKLMVGTTSAVRRAKNQENFLRRIRRECQVDPKVISGEEEALLSYMGVVYDRGTVRDTFLTFDLGGGSTDIAIGKDLTPKYIQSVPTGSIRFYEKQNWRGVVSLSRIRQVLSNTTEDQLSTQVQKKMKNPLQQRSDFFPIGVGGTMTTLAMIYLGLKEHDREAIEGTVIHYEELWEIIGELARRTPEERVDDLHVSSGRKEYILGGACLFYAFMDFFRLEKIMATCRGLRHGLILGEFV